MFSEVDRGRPRPAATSILPGPRQASIDFGGSAERDINIAAMHAAYRLVGTDRPATAGRTETTQGAK
jgi:hypothetical protein